MICAWIDTSSAVVGSSAMISFGFARERQRDHDALAHAAGELVRIVIDASLRRRDADLGQQVERALPRGARATCRGACVIVSISWRADRVAAG
mgnify:CR=1 FL=1